MAANQRHYTTPWQTIETHAGGSETTCTCYPWPKITRSLWEHKKKIDPVSLENRYGNNRQRRENQRAAAADIEQGANASTDSAVAVEESGAAATNDESVVTTEDNQSTAVNEPDYEPSVSSELVIV